MDEQELSQHGIDIQDLSSDNEKIFCNKKALTRFLDALIIRNNIKKLFGK